MKNDWYYWGKYFGFPDCCIDYFMVNAGNWDLRYSEGFPLQGTGYVPCPCCLNKSEQELINTINSKRFCPTEFPHEGIFKEDEEYKNKLIKSGVIK